MPMETACAFFRRHADDYADLFKRQAPFKGVEQVARRQVILFLNAVQERMFDVLRNTDEEEIPYVMVDFMHDVASILPVVEEEAIGSTAKEQGDGETEFRLDFGPFSIDTDKPKHKPRHRHDTPPPPNRKPGPPGPPPKRK